MVHHSSRKFNLTTALRQPWTGLTVWPFYLPLIALGVHPAALAFCSSVEPRLPVLDPHRADRQAAPALRVRPQHALPPPGPPRLPGRLSGPQLRRHPDRLGPALRLVRRRRPSGPSSGSPRTSRPTTRCGWPPMSTPPSPGTYGPRTAGASGPGGCSAGRAGSRRADAAAPRRRRTAACRDRSPPRRRSRPRDGTRGRVPLAAFCRRSPLAVDLRLALLAGVRHRSCTLTKPAADAAARRLRAAARRPPRCSSPRCSSAGAATSFLLLGGDTAFLVGMGSLRRRTRLLLLLFAPYGRHRAAHRLAAAPVRRRCSSAPSRCCGPDLPAGAADPGRRVQPAAHRDGATRASGLGPVAGPAGRCSCSPTPHRDRVARLAAAARPRLLDHAHLCAAQ